MKPWFLFLGLLLFFKLSLAAAPSFPCFYPENKDYFTFSDGKGHERMFLRQSPDHTMLAGEGGWRGRVLGRKAEIASSSGDRSLKFNCGIPVDGATYHGKQSLKDVFPSAEDITEYVRPHTRKDIWGASGRARFLFENPNVEAVVLSSIFLLSLGLAFSHCSLALRIAGAVAALASSWFLFRTESRGGVLATAVAAGFLLLTIIFRQFRHRTKCCRKILIGACIALIALTAILATTHVWQRYTKEMFAHDESNQLRLNMLQAFPTMVADSPDGVGFGNSGPTFLTWYSDEKDRATRTLISSHLTWLVEFDDIERLAYLFGWFFMLAFLAVVTAYGGSALPLAVWISLSIAGLFNPVLENPYVWILPSLTLALTLKDRKSLSIRVIAIPAIAALAMSIAVLAGIKMLGRRSAGQPTLRIDAKTVKINGTEPQVWIAGDTLVVGGWSYVGREILGYLVEKESSESVGYVESLDALPPCVDRLVLTGRLAREYLERTRNPERTKSLCNAKSILIVSPSVPATEFESVIPKSGHIRAVVGALAKHLDPAYESELPPWIRIVPGAWLYIPGWIHLSMSF